MKRKYPKNRDGMWGFIRKHKTFYVEEVALALGLDRSSVRAYLDPLVKGGFVRQAPLVNSDMPPLFVLVKDVGSITPELDREGKPLPVSGNQKMWAAMRVLKVFDYKDLALSAGTPQSATKAYCVALRKAGYLILKGAAKAPAIAELYQFNPKMDTGFYAPQILRGKKVYDRNLNKEVA